MWDAEYPEYSESRDGEIRAGGGNPRGRKVGDASLCFGFDLAEIKVTERALYGNLKTDEG
jgi:hypothetical protein